MTLTLTTIGNGFCQAVTDQVTITFTPAPTAEAGTGTVLCANNADIQLAGSVTVANGGTWSGVQGTFTPNACNAETTIKVVGTAAGRTKITAKFGDSTAEMPLGAPKGVTSMQGSGR